MNDKARFKFTASGRRKIDALMARNYHAPADGDLFAPRALCGATASGEPDGVLRLYQPGAEVTCADCRTLLLTEEPA